MHLLFLTRSGPYVFFLIFHGADQPTRIRLILAIKSTIPHLAPALEGFSTLLACGFSSNGLNIYYCYLLNYQSRTSTLLTHVAILEPDQG